MGVVISLCVPDEIWHTQHAPASHIQQTVAGPHLSQGALPIGREVVGSIHFYCYLLTCRKLKSHSTFWNSQSQQAIA